MSTDPAKTWAARIESGTFTKGQTRAWANVVAPLSRGFAVTTRTNLTAPEASVLVAGLLAAPVGLTDGHTALGLDWLRRYANRLTGPGSQTLTAYAVEHGEQGSYLDRFDRFTFDGRVYIESRWREYGPHGHASEPDERPSICLPVWTVHLTDGRRFAYYATPWQQSAYGSPPPARWWWLDEAVTR